MRCIQLTISLVFMTLVIPKTLGLGTSELELQMKRFVKQQWQHQPEQRLDINVSPMDKRIKVRSCQADIVISSKKPIKAGHNTLQIDCRSPQWKLYGNVQLKLYGKLWATATPLRRGQVLARAQLKQVDVNISRYQQGHYTNLNDLLGLVVKRNLRDNAVITPNMLDQANLIFKGDLVAIISRQGTMEVKMQGTALENGKQNRQIRVKNNSSGKTVKAYVMAPGRVEVIF